MHPSRATDGYFDTSLSQRAGVRTPSWISWISQDERHREGNRVRFPSGKPTIRQRVSNIARKVLCLASKPLPDDYCHQQGGLEMAGRYISSSTDPVETWKTKVQLLEAEIERLNKRLDDLRKDYRTLYTRSQHADSRSAHFEWKFDQVREAFEDLSRVVYETYGKKEFRALKAKIEEEKRRVVGDKGFLTSSGMLGINTPDREDQVNVA